MAGPRLTKARRPAPAASVRKTDKGARKAIPGDRLQRLLVKLRSKESVEGADLRGLWLCYRDLSGMDLRRVNFHSANLSHADLSGSDLRGADFRHALLSGANLSGAIVDGAIFTGAVVQAADCSGMRGLASHHVVEFARGGAKVATIE